MIGLGGTAAHANTISPASITITGASNSAGNPELGALTATGLETLLNGATSQSATGGNAGKSVDAFINDDQLVNGKSRTGASIASGGAAGTETTLNNKLTALAVGDLETNAGNLANIGNNGTANGLASLIATQNIGSATNPMTVVATVSNNALTTNIVGPVSHSGDTLGQSGNLIAATATLSSANTSISGNLPSTYAAGVAGGATLTPGASTSSAQALSSTGNILASTDQLNEFAGQLGGSTAVATGNTTNVDVSNNSSSASSVADSLNNSDNTISASYNGNQSQAAVPVSGSPALSGSAVISNMQQNLNDAPSTPVTTPLAANASSNNIWTQLGSSAPGNVAAMALQGGVLTNNNNSITASATNNTTSVTNGNTQAGDVLSLAGGESLAGATTTQSNSAALGTNPTTTTKADLAVVSFQNNQSAALSVQANGNNVGAMLDNATSATLSVSSNQIAASATGNDALNEIDAPGGTNNASTASLIGLAAVNNVQSSTAGSTLSATTQGNVIASTLGNDALASAPGDATQLAATNVSQSMDGDQFNATAVTNEATNNLNENATTIQAQAAGGAPALAGLSAAVSGEAGSNSSTANAGLSINNLQYVDATSGSTASATNDSIAVLDENGATATGAGSLSGGSVSITNATEKALAGGNLAADGLGVNATTLAGSAGIVDAQNNASTDTATVNNASSVQNNVLGKQSDLAIVLAPDTTGGATGTISGETVAIGNAAATSTTPPDNMLAAVAYNNQGTDTLTVTGNNATGLPGASATPLTGVLSSATAWQSPSIAATYGSLADQDATGAATASFSASTSSGNVTAIPVMLSDQASGLDATTGSTLSVAANEIEAVSFDNLETNTANIAPTTLSVSGSAANPAAVAAALTIQSESGTGTSSSILGAAGLQDKDATTSPALFAVSVGSSTTSNIEVLKASTLETNYNFAIEQAEDNNATTSLNAASTNITAAGQVGSITGLGAMTPGASAVKAAYVAQTMQNAGGNASATPSGSNPANLGALVNVDGGEAGSSLEANGNQFQSLAQGNMSTTTANIGSGTAASVDTTAAAYNAQIASGTITATTGSPTNVSATTPMVSAVQIALDGNMNGGATEIENNGYQASAFGNQGTTGLTVSGNSLQSGLAASAPASVAVGGQGAITVNAAYMTANDQAETGPVTSTSSGAFDIADLASTPTITGETLTVSGNGVNALAEGNLANNSLSLAATNSTTPATQPSSPSLPVLAANGALTNVQTQAGTVTANAGVPQTSYGMVVEAPAGASNSTVSLLDNANNATAYGNNATDAATFTGNEIGSAEITPTDASISSLAGLTTIAADLVLGNAQTSNSAVAANAASLVANNDASTAAINGSTINASDNATTATAINNNAVNALTVAGAVTTTGSGANASTSLTPAASVTATTLLTSIQRTNASATASASQQVKLDGASTSNATLEVSDNDLTATAANNQATNSLTVDASAIGGASHLSGVTYPGSQADVNAADALYNAQYGSTVSPGTLLSPASAASVTASASYFAPAATTDSATTLTGNQLVAQAQVNEATNNLTISANDTTPFQPAATTATAGKIDAQADYALVNHQVAGTSGDANLEAVSATGSETIGNSDISAPNTSGLNTGSLTITGNVERVMAFGNDALGSANTAGNVLNATATDLTATAALVNAQTNYDAVNASGAFVAGASLAGTGNNNATTPIAAAQNATLTVDNNTLSIQAAGNAASNALNATANAAYSTAAMVGTSSLNSGANGSTDVAQANYALESHQDNQGNVTAHNSPATQIGVALNNNSGAQTNYTGMTNTAINVANNNVTVAAYGNSVANTATLTALNSGNPTVAVTSSQFNNGNIMASATGIQINVVTASAGAGYGSGSSMSLAGNSITARAVGNSGTTIVK